MAKMTMAQALVKFLDNQYVSFDGKENKFVDGIFTIFGQCCMNSTAIPANGAAA